MENEVEDPPSISVIVPVKNTAKTITDLLDSLMSLDYDTEKLDIVVVDGNSTDGTRKIVEEYPVKLIDEEGRGLNAARNTGIKWSNGEIVAYTDGDCIVPPNWVKSIAKNFKSPLVGFVGGNVEGYDKRDFLSVYMDETFFSVKPSFKWRKVFSSLNLRQFPAGCNMAFRRNALAKIDYFDERIEYGFDDLLPVEEVGAVGFRIVLDPEVYVYHQHRRRLDDMLYQHFNYGRGGAKLIARREDSQLAQWFTTYLISSTFYLGLTALLLAMGLLLNLRVPFEIALGSSAFFYALMTILYLETAIRTRSFRKMLFYPILDITRGVVFTLGGLIQYFREMENQEEWVTAKQKTIQNQTQPIEPIKILKEKDDKKSLRD